MCNIYFIEVVFKNGKVVNFNIPEEGNDQIIWYNDNNKDKSHWSSCSWEKIQILYRKGLINSIKPCYRRTP